MKPEMIAAWMRRLSPLLVGGAFFLLLALIQGVSRIQLADTDRFYHFALSREMAEQGALWLRALPQLPALGWHEYFPDKEFLFHFFTGLASRVGGDRGVELVALASAALAALAIYLLARRFVAGSVAFLATLAVFASHVFLFRMLFVRPHVLGIAFLLFFFYALVERRPKLAAAAAALFALSYHAFYLPLAALGIAAFLPVLLPGEERKITLKTASYGLAGLIAGLVLNPYFPSNVASGIWHARIPFLMAGELRRLDFGMELYPVSAPVFVEFYWLPVALFVLGLFLLGRSWSTQKRSYPLLFTLSMVGFFLLLTSRSVRAGEYLIPLSGGLLALLLAELGSKKKQLFCVGGLLALQALFLFQNFQSTMRHHLDEAPSLSAWDAVSSIPRLEKGSTVYNCDWERGPFVFYARPELRFVNVLDPSFLYFYNRPLFYGQEAMKNGKTADLQGMLRRSFHADFVLCRSEALAEQLRSDPHFRQLYPREQDFRKAYAPATYVFEVAETANQHFVRDYRAYPATARTAAEARALTPPGPDATGQDLQTLETELLLGQASVAEGLRCAFLRPAKRELERIAGSELLAIGGGQSMRVWRDGKLLFASGQAFPRPRIVQTIVPLSSPVSAKDDFVVLVCSSGEAYWGLSLAGWKKEELARICAWKKAAPGAAKSSSSAAMFQPEAESCVGRWAVPSLPDSFR